MGNKLAKDIPDQLSGLYKVFKYKDGTTIHFKADLKEVMNERTRLLLEELASKTSYEDED